MAADYDFIEGFSYLGFGLVWLAFLIYWMINNYHKNRRHLKPLHKFMNFVVICKCIQCFCMIGYILNQSGVEYWSIAVTSMITIYKTFIYTSLVLASKGFCLISDVLQRRDLSVIALVMGSVYLTYSAYFIEPGLVSILLLCMIVFLFYITSKYTLENIRLLKVREVALIENNVQNMIAPLQAKIALFNRFLKLSCYYFVTQFLVFFIVVVVYGSGNGDENFDLAISYLDEFFELTGIAGIMYLLRPKSNIPYFDINFIEPNRPNRPLAPFFNASLPEGLASSVSPDKPFLLIAPKGYISETPYKNLLIANPVQGK